MAELDRMYTWKETGRTDTLNYVNDMIESLPSNPSIESMLEEMPEYFELVREAITSYDWSEKNGWIARINNEDSEIEAEFFAYTVHGAVSWLRDILSSNQ